jgi:MFS family permease
MVYLGITVLSTIMLYYELYVGGSVTTLILPRFGMTFSFFVYTLAFGALIGAFGSLFAGITDRFGRTNIVVVGLIVTAIFIGIVIPASTTKWQFTLAGWVVGFVEGICLVATPALIRDFSPQVGRATAMGFWTSGPVLGSLIVATVGTITLPSHPSVSYWTHEYYICGIAGGIVALIAVIGLRELSPQLRDQLMVTMHDRALIEARAKGIDVAQALKSPFRQLVKPDVVVSALGVSIFLLIYYTAVGFGLIYFLTVFGFTTKQGNGLGNWNWGFNVIAVILFGIISDRLKVRKPFMIAGGAAAAVMTVIYLEQAGHHTGYYHLAALVAILSFTLGVAYVPWMASFTETVEARNPALTATGLAIWGWIIRVVVFVSYLFIPVVIHSMNPLVQYGAPLQQVVATYPNQVATLQVIHPDTLAGLQKTPPDPAAVTQAIGQISTAFHIGPAQATARLVAVGALPASAKATLSHAPAVVNAQKEAPQQWKNWYWICFGGCIFFLLTVPLMRGRWSPKQARADEEAHEAMVQSEMAKLGISG